MRKNLISALIVAGVICGALAGGQLLVGQGQDPNDFTIRVRRDMTLPHPLTTGEWRIESGGPFGIVSHQSEGRDCYPRWHVPVGVSRMTVGPGNLDDICNGRAWADHYSHTGDARATFTKISGGGGGPPSAGVYSDCVPDDVAFIFDWYEVKVCYETSDGRVGQGRPKSIGSRESGLIWFFNQDNIELLVKVLNGCRVNGYRWVFVAPATDVAFNLYVEAPLTGERWLHRNPQGAQTVAADIQALQCVTAASSARTETVVRRPTPERR